LTAVTKIRLSSNSGVYWTLAGSLAQLGYA
jgi:hypothetical protein